MELSEKDKPITVEEFAEVRFSLDSSNFVFSSDMFSFGYFDFLR
jgi:hypothetical protein